MATLIIALIGCNYYKFTKFKYYSTTNGFVISNITGVIGSNLSTGKMPLFSITGKS